MENGVSGLGLRRAVRPVAVDSELASGTATNPLHHTEERSARENILNLRIATQIHVSHGDQ